MWEKATITLTKCNVATFSPIHIILCQGIPYFAPVDGQSVYTSSPRVSIERHIWLAHEMHLSLPSMATHSWNSQWILHQAIFHWSLVHVHHSWPIRDPHKHSRRLQWQNCSQYRSIDSCWCAAVEYFSFVANTISGQNMPHRPYGARSHMVLDKSVAGNSLPPQRPILFESQFSDILTIEKMKLIDINNFLLHRIHAHFYHRTF